jgi:hypothetical protein
MSITRVIACLNHSHHNCSYSVFVMFHSFGPLKRSLIQLDVRVPRLKNVHRHYSPSGRPIVDPTRVSAGGSASMVSMQPHPADPAAFRIPPAHEADGVTSSSAVQTSSPPPSPPETSQVNISGPPSPPTPPVPARPLMNMPPTYQNPPFHTHKFVAELEKTFPTPTARSLMRATRALLVDRIGRVKREGLAVKDLENVRAPVICNTYPTYL